MLNPFKKIFAVRLLLSILMTGFAFYVNGQNKTKVDTSKGLHFPIKQDYGEEPQDVKPRSIFLKDPSNFKTEYTFDEKTGTYIVTQKSGKVNYRNPTYLTLDEYKRYDLEKSRKNYWRKKIDAEAKENKENTSLIPKIIVSGETFDRIFGGNTVDIRPNGSAELLFGVNSSFNGNPAIPLRNRRLTTFDFNQKIQLNVIGKIGEKLKLTTSYNTEATFDFENQMKIEYNGTEDEILQKIEAGNVSLPLTGQLITGSQSLFGVKATTKFGKLIATTVLSQQRGKKTEVDVPPGGGQMTTTILSADNYEANRHYFLSQFFRNKYDSALAHLPFIASQAAITRIEIWVTNRSASPENRNVMAMMDLAEDADNVFQKANIKNYGVVPYTYNDRNTLYGELSKIPALRNFDNVNVALSSNMPYLKIGRDYEKIIARKLLPTEFTLNQKLGYISLNQALNNDEVLAVAYQYTYNGDTYQVGEFSTDGIDHPKTLILKMIKGTLVNVRLPVWDLMMKNVYSLNAYQVSKDDFKLDILHTNISTGIDYNFIPEGKISKTVLLQAMGLDKLNKQLDPQPDGFFDFIEGTTILADKGRIIFPSIEPFGSHLYSKMVGDPNLADPENIVKAKKYVFQQLYDSTRFIAQQFPKLNRYKLRVQYRSSSGSEISLNALNIPQGSVQVTCGGQILTENTDYTVDYNVGRVKIINESILNSGKPIKVSLESNSMFSTQQKSMIGTRLDYKVNNDFALGSTLMQVSERPLTQKVNIGDEPVSNSIVGLDGNYRTEVPLITRALDKLPFYDTKDASSVQLQGEVAKLFPGNASAISKNGISYMDDFESSQTTIDLKSQSSWSLASTPQGQALFKEAGLNNDINYGVNRAKLAWYTVDPIFTFNPSSTTPAYISSDANAQSDNRVRHVMETELFPNKQFAQGQQLQNMPMLDLAFYPEEKGPYNYDVDLATSKGFGDGIDASGKLINPSSRWGGIQRRMETTDFENSNVQYVQFWMMDPFNKDNPNKTNSGELYLNLGEVSEDVLKDSKKAFENGLPKDANIVDVENSNWGRVSKLQTIINSFDNDPNSRVFQDVGLDGLSNTDEISFFKSSFVDPVLKKFGPTSGAYLQSQSDASNDDYKFYLDPSYDGTQSSILERYKNFNGMEGNSPISTGTSNNAATTLPNVEDINRDNTLNENETYYQYRIKIDPNEMTVGKNYITNVVDGTGQLKNGQNVECKWYQFRVPIREPDEVIGTISDFRSIRFMRMFMKGFEQPIVLRFGKLELVRGEWRKYDGTLQQAGDYLLDDKFNKALFNITAVNVEEHSSRVPVSYVLPPDIERQRQVNAPNQALMNEQAMQFDICNLEDGYSKAAFKTMDVDMRLYQKLQMYTHAESAGPETLKDGELKTFVRLGSDFNENYYEYELPMKVTSPGATARTDVWPEENNFIIELKELIDLKIKRNNAVIANTASTNKPFEEVINGHTIRIVGNPILSSVRTLMIGVRNPKKMSPDSKDNGRDLCATVWVNELRLTDFDNFGGWATVGRLSTKLADLGNLSATGGYSTPGFGSIDKKLNERSKEITAQYDLSGQFELGKLLPKFLNLRVPFYAGYGETFILPRFSPLAPDIEYNDYLNGITNETVREDAKLKIQDYTRRKGFNFTNVKKEKGKNGGKSHIYDIENISLTYAYTITEKRNINLKFHNVENYKGGLTYSYSSSAKPIKPFGKLKLGKSEWFKLLTEINFTPMPSRIGFKADFNRDYNEQLVRPSTEFEALIRPQVQKNLNLTRTYDLSWSLTKSITADFTATNNSRIDEQWGRIIGKYDYGDRMDDSTTAIRDSIKKSLRTGGRNTAYQHSANLNYNIPINKIPTFNWITSSVRYSANYQWTAASLAAKDSLGNSIQNSNNQQLNNTLNMTTLYNKWKYFKKISSPPVQAKPKRAKNEDPDYLQTKVDSIKKVIKKPKLKLRATQKDSLKSSIKKLNKRIDSLRSAQAPPIQWLENTVKGILSVKNITIGLTETNGTMLSGYKPSNQYVGLRNDASTNNISAPGLDFVFGDQSMDIARRSAENGWLIKSPSLNNPYTHTNTKTLSLKASVEPYKDIRITLSANKTEGLNNTEIFRWIPKENDWGSLNPQQTGNYSVSFLSIKTIFASEDKNFTNSAWEQFKENRKIISARKTGNNPNDLSLIPDSGYLGNNVNAQDVIIPSFIAAYTGTDAKTAALESFPKIPLPNWTIAYDGLSKMDIFKKFFKSATVNHGYKSTYTVSSYTSNLNYNANGTVTDLRGNYISPVVVTSVSVIESFSPLLGIDLQWNNSLLTKLEFKSDRNMNLSLANTQLTEIRGTEYTLVIGYVFKDVQVGIKFAGEKIKLKSDMNFRSDISIRDNITIVRKAYDNSNQATVGQRTVTLKNSINYQASTRLTIRFYLDHVFNSPFVSTSFPTSNTNGGVSLRFTLGQ